MAMGYDPTAAKGLRLNHETTKVTGSAISVHGVRYDPLRYRTMLDKVLGLDAEILERKSRIRTALDSRIGQVCDVPGELREAMRIEAPSLSLALMRHLGVDPVRMVIATHAARMQATDGVRSIAMRIERAFSSDRNANRSDMLDLKVTLGPGVFWRGSQLTVRKTVIPGSMLGSLQGRPMRDVLSHEWSGWDDVRIVGAVQRGGSLIVSTDAEALEFLQG